MPVFDRSYLPPARAEFVAIADTHYMLDMGDRALEFESRRRQSARAEYALAAVASVGASLVVHMGDLVQEFPEQPAFSQAMEEACGQLARHGLRPRFVAGNHDVGDKPDPTMPTAWVTAASLADHHARWGRSWGSWDEGDLHFVILNSQIMNSLLPEAAEQARWLEADLVGHHDRRIFVFIHLPPFLHSPDEPGLGHYDNIDQPARGWLLSLLAQHPVELVLAAHVHWSFANRIGAAEYLTTPSVAFTRPGFGELFSSAPADEQGRNDVAKLGFFLVRIHEQGHRVHLIRTGGRTEEPAGDECATLLTRTAADLPASPLGVTLRHQLVNEVEVPLAWPSAVRQPVRNDYPLLACCELGVRYLRVPASDLDDALQRERLAWLRAEGAQVTASWLWRPGFDLAGAVAPRAEWFDAVEVQLAGSLWPDAACLRALRACRQQMGKALLLSPAMPGWTVPGKQHSRTQTAYQIDELAPLNKVLAEHDCPVDRVLCRFESGDVFASKLRSLCASPGALSHIAAIELEVSLSGDEGEQSIQVAEAFWLSAQSGARLWLGPLLDLDRTMDVTLGLLDRRCNPRRAFHVARCLNTLLFSSGEPWQPVAASELEGVHLRTLQQGALVRATLAFADDAGKIDRAMRLRLEESAASQRVYGLASGMVTPLATIEQLPEDDDLLLLVSGPELLGSGRR